MKKIILGFMVLCSSIFAGEITVAAAANVTYAMGELVKEFNKTNPETKVQVTLSSSGKLVSQIENGAPFDIFMSADMKFPQALFDKKLTKTAPVIYAQGALAMLSSKELDYSKGINVLNDSSISKIVSCSGALSSTNFDVRIPSRRTGSPLQLSRNKLHAVSHKITGSFVGF